MNGGRPVQLFGGGEIPRENAASDVYNQTRLQGTDLQSGDQHTGADDRPSAQTMISDHASCRGPSQFATDSMTVCHGQFERPAGLP